MRPQSRKSRETRPRGRGGPLRGSGRSARKEESPGRRLECAIRIERRDDHWVWVGGPAAPGASATTLGRLILVRRDRADDARLMRHELVHVRQWRTLGVVGFVRRYLGAYFRWRIRGYPHWGAYRRIPLEIEAEWEARQLKNGRN